MSRLDHIIRQMIAEEGPMPLDRYMTLCLAHPEHGYYMTRDPLGAAGDFTTAPEISQVFGELIGVWVAQLWQAMGARRHFALVELGPGRGTLMADILRVLDRVEDCRKAADVNFVETSPVLRAAQAERIPHATWHSSVASLPARQTIVIANEFFDALPIRQFERRNGKVFERCVGLHDNVLDIGLVPSPVAMPWHGDGIYEDAGIRNSVARQLGDHIATQGGAALVVDYGHARTALGDTLQAMIDHAYCPITDSPGEADITSHVDFEALGRAFGEGGAKPVGLMTQGEFLSAMGLEARTQVLSSKLTGDAHRQLIAATERLAHPAQMGQLFKVMAVTSAGLAPPYPFGVQ